MKLFIEKSLIFLKGLFLRKKKVEKPTSVALEAREKRIDDLTNDIISKYCCCHELQKIAASKDVSKPRG